MTTKKGLAARFRGSPHIKKGGIYCYCCNSYKGKEKGVPGRTARRTAKQELKSDEQDGLQD